MLLLGIGQLYRSERPTQEDTRLLREDLAKRDDVITSHSLFIKFLGRSESRKDGQRKRAISKIGFEKGGGHPTH